MDPERHATYCAYARAGPSPRVRGNLHHRAEARDGARSIPACAETRVVKPRLRVPRGPSPRVRGNRVPSAGTLASRRSIPACAGKPRGHASANSAGAVHPRVCGETDAIIVELLLSRGPSPRVRGNRVPDVERDDPKGSIPACAGKPSSWPRRPEQRRVHPRVCGETVHTVAVYLDDQGPSPRVRGNPSLASALSALRGPSPRVRGNRRDRPTPWRCSGSIPRVRGNLRCVAMAHDDRRSIPACAGKPFTAEKPNEPTKVHPRVCGETNPEAEGVLRQRGPSPRVRGNQGRGRIHQVQVGSIPACAGKPRRAEAGRREDGVHPRVCGETTPPPTTRPGVRVHPRVCGETRERDLVGQAVGGPSPRVRGNRRRHRPAAPARGSIPACAGKPLGGRAHRGCAEVHPRVCGETGSGEEVAGATGVHPRVCGETPSDPHESTIYPGPSRVCGETLGVAAAGAVALAAAGPSPRVRETAAARASRGSTSGPSPRVRGNRDGPVHSLSVLGSIPACAGKPSSLACA